MSLPSILCCLGAALSALQVCAADLPTLPDISYGSHERHKLDLWQAEAAKPTPLVIFIHGGGWQGGDKHDAPPKLVAFMLAHGVSVASINYRYTSIATLPAPQVDAACAVQFLRAHASEYRLDPARFSAYGISAGGCSALWLAYHDDLADPQSADPVSRQSTRLQAAVGMSAQSSLEPEVLIGWMDDRIMGHAMVPRAVGAKSWAEVREPHPEWAAALREASPITHVSAGDPPVLLSFPKLLPLPAENAGAAIHHPLFGQKLKERADTVGVPCILRIEDQAEATLPKPETFLLKVLTGR